MSRNFEKFKRRRREVNSKWLWKSCKSKSKFEEFEAKARAREWGQRAYLCNICHQWHLTKE